MTPDDEYRISNSGAVAEEFKQVTALARAQGRLPIMVVAARWIMTELAREPFRFGESRYTEGASGLIIRCGFARPLYVEFGVHEPTRLVFLRKFRLVR
jgi:hypothetical protein